MPDRPKPPKPQPVPRVLLSNLVDDSPHTIFEDEQHVKCIRCMSCFNKKDPQAKRWIISQCPIVGTSEEQPIPVFYTHMRRGRHNVHHTHKLYVYKGLPYCNKCGCRAGCNVLKGLAEPCQPPTDYGKASLCAIRDGRLPAGLTSWPSEPQSKSIRTKAIVAMSDPVAKRPKVMRPNRVPLGSSFAMSLTSSGSEITHPPQVFQHDLQDLLELHDAGHVVIWPEGYDASSARQFVSFINFTSADANSSTTEVATLVTDEPTGAPDIASSPASSSTVDGNILADLIDLSEAGEKVIWPPGYTLEIAKRAVSRPT